MSLCIRTKSGVKTDVAAVAPAIGIPLMPIREADGTEDYENRDRSE